MTPGSPNVLDQSRPAAFEVRDRVVAEQLGGIGRRRRDLLAAGRADEVVLRVEHVVHQRAHVPLVARGAERPSFGGGARHLRASTRWHARRGREGLGPSRRLQVGKPVVVYTRHLSAPTSVAEASPMATTICSSSARDVAKLSRTYWSHPVPKVGRRSRRRVRGRGRSAPGRRGRAPSSRATTGTWPPAAGTGSPAVRRPAARPRQPAVAVEVGDELA